MQKQVLSIGRRPSIVIDAVHGDLRVLGWERDEILAKADDDVLNLKQDDNSVAVMSDGDLILNLPKGAALKIKEAHGDVEVRGLSGTLDIGEIHGVIELRGVGAVHIGSLHADLSLRGASGDVQISSIAGDVSIEGVEGNLVLDSVDEDLYLRGVRGNITATVSGDAVLSLEPKPGQVCTIVAEDDILLRLPENANAVLQLDGDTVRVDVPGVSSEKDGSHSITLGDGSAKISLHAGGDLVVTSREGEWESAAEFGDLAGVFDWGSLGRDLEAQISRHVAVATRRATEKTEAAMRRANEKADAAARRARERADAAARRVEHKIRHIGRQAGRWNFNWPFDPSAVAASPQPISDEERLIILRMLQEKKISSEEAEKLLSALEGGQ